MHLESAPLPSELIQAAIEVSFKGHYGTILKPLVDAFVLPGTEDFWTIRMAQGNWRAALTHEEVEELARCIERRVSAATTASASVLLKRIAYVERILGAPMEDTVLMLRDANDALRDELRELPGQGFTAEPVSTRGRGGDGTL